MLHDMRFRLPKAKLSRKEIGRDRIETFDEKDNPLDQSLPHIQFSPNKL